MSGSPSGFPLPSADRWRAIETLLDEVLDLPHAERRAFLEKACPDDPALRAEVASLLAAYAPDEQHAPHHVTPAAARFAALWRDEEDDAAFQSGLALHYAFGEILARGTTAVVHRARRRSDGVDVALKALSISSSAHGAARFRREIAIVSGLQHPHILPILESGESGGRQWYAMPLADGGSLGAWLRTHGPVALLPAVRMLEDIASALSHAHARGVVHRDLKPENVLLAASGAMVADFGVAKAVGDALKHVSDARDEKALRTATGIGLGTLAYMAPEQASGARDVDHRADIFSFGVLAYEMIAGAPPFVADGRQAMLTAHLSQSPTPLGSRVRRLPVLLNDLVMRCLAKQPGQRPASAGELVTILGQVAASLDTTDARSASAWRRLGRRLGIRW